MINLKKILAATVVWLCLTSSVFAAGKPVVGVLYLTSDSPEVSRLAVSSATTWLTHISSIHVVERWKLAQAFSEERLRREGIVQSTGATGEARDADYVIIGEVSWSMGGPWTNGGGQAVVHLRLVDVKHNVGSVVWTGEGSTVQYGGGNLGDVINVATSDAIYKLRAVFPTRGKVLTVEGDRIYIDLTTADDMAVGDKVLLYPNEHNVLNPRTGATISVRGEPVKGRVIEAHDDYCVVSAHDRVPTGTTVELVP